MRSESFFYSIKTLAYLQKTDIFACLTNFNGQEGRKLRFCINFVPKNVQITYLKKTILFSMADM